MFEGNKVVAKAPLIWKTSISMCVVIPHKTRNCDNCKKKHILCDGCDKLVNHKREVSANLNEVKRQPPNEFGYMLPKYIRT